MRYGILGPLELNEDGRSIEIAGAKQRTLLAMLLLNANRVVSSDALIDALWEEQPPCTAVKALQVHVSQLRKLLGKERLETRAPGYVLRVEPDAFDLERFSLTARSVEAQHQLRPHAFSERMLLDQRLQLTDELGVAAPSDVTLDPFLETRETELVQAGDLGLGEALVCELGEGRPTPQRQRFVETILFV